MAKKFKVKDKILFVLMLCLCTSLLGQKEANHWMVGYNLTDVNFNSSPPSKTYFGPTTAPIYNTSYRSSAAISDKNGNLLFFTNGDHIWDKNNALMPNGNKICPISAGTGAGISNYDQGSLIVPLPGSDSLYYVFCISRSTSPERQLLLSVVDMTLNGGLGDVLSSPTLASGQKAIFCNVANTTGCVNAVRHANGIDLWIIVHDVGSNQFLSFLLDENGWVTATDGGFNTGAVPPPVSSYVGTVTNFLYGNGTGINPSSDGSKIAAAYYGERVWEVYDFNASTGQLSNTLTLTPPPGMGPHDIAFSADGNVLYGTAQNLGIRQWDLSSGNHDTIKVKFTDLPMTASQGLELGPDCKIYARFSCASTTKLDVIYEPNKYGVDGAGIPLCDYRLNNFTLSSPGSCYLPSIPLNIFPKNVDFNASTVCYGDSTAFSIVSCFKSATDTYSWNFDDPASSTNTSTLSDPKHLFSKAGTFNVKCTITHNTGTPDIITNSVIVHAVPDVDFGKDVSICQGDHVTLDATIPNAASYLWQDLLAGGPPSYLATVAPYTYWVTATDINGCFDKDTIVLSIYDAPVLSNDTAICPGETILLSASTNPDAPVLWNNSTTPSATFLVAKPGTYWASICNMKDTIIVTEKDAKVCDTTPPPPALPPTFVSIPNTFTPNNDGQNDVFVAVTATGITQMQSTIYNRWGKEVYSSIDKNIGWNGTTQNGKDADDGTYFYIISYTANDGNTVTQKGTIQLMR